MRRCAARRSDGPSRGCRVTPAGHRPCGGGGGTPLPAPRAPRHGNVAVRAPVRARVYGAGRRVRCRCAAERAIALNARVLHARVWNSLALRTGCSQTVVMHTYTSFKGLALRFRCGSLHLCSQGSEGVSVLEMTLKANRVTFPRKIVLPQGSQGSDGACPAAPPHRPELRPETARSDFQGSTRPR